MTSEEISAYATRLAELRDEDAAVEERDECMASFFRGRSQGYALALDLLHVQSGGVFGEDFRTQGEVSVR